MFLGAGGKDSRRILHILDIKNILESPSKTTFSKKERNFIFFNLEVKIYYNLIKKHLILVLNPLSTLQLEREKNSTKKRFFLSSPNYFSETRIRSGTDSPRPPKKKLFQKKAFQRKNFQKMS